MGDSTVPLVLSIVVPALFAAFLGYFLFYARITDVYFGVITLTVTLILYKLMGSTSGAEYTIGSAPIGGYNGIPAIPPLNLPGSPDTILSLDGLYYASGLTLLAVYLGLRLMLKSRFGQVLVEHIDACAQRLERLGARIGHGDTHMLSFQAARVLACLCGSFRDVSVTALTGSYDQHIAGRDVAESGKGHGRSALPLKVARRK